MAGPPPQKKSNTAVLVIVVLVVLLCVVPVGGIGAITMLGRSVTTTTTTTRLGASGGGTLPSSGAQADGQAGAPTGVGTSKENLVPVGTGIEVAKGWTVQVNSAQRNANDLLAAENRFSKPDAGKQFLVVNASIKNGSGKPGSAGINVKASLLPPSGVAIDSFSSCGLTVPDSLSMSADLQPGATITGNLCFEVSVAEASSAVLLAEPEFTLDEVKDQRFFSLGA